MAGVPNWSRTGRDRSEPTSHMVHINKRGIVDGDAVDVLLIPIHYHYPNRCVHPVHPLQSTSAPTATRQSYATPLWQQQEESHTREWGGGEQGRPQLGESLELAPRTLRTPFSRPPSLARPAKPGVDGHVTQRTRRSPLRLGKGPDRRHVIMAPRSSLPVHTAATSHLPTALPLLAHAATTSPPSDARVARPQVTRSSLPAHTPATSHPPTALPLLLLAHHAHATTTPTSPDRRARHL
ncbi:hypothetical protein FPV67DRAFT_1677740 [Lyophyllum atratum]|nr:hypothetical protein FPV67DRAFT_1677740 [Lyophyllum atratum]